VTELPKSLSGQYFEAIGTRDKRKLKPALAAAHDIRKFEIDLYWKRANYFWLLQAAIFTALGFMWHGEAADAAGLVPLGLTSLGLLTAIASWFAAEGSKFWQENWERHIDFLEDNQGVILHKTAWVGGDGIRWSVSGTNGWLNIFFSVFWFSLFVSQVVISAEWGKIELEYTPNSKIEWNAVKASVIVLLTILGFAALWSRGSRLEGKRVWPRLVTMKKTDLRIVRRNVEP
jgi:hypothetical protein